MSGVPVSLEAPATVTIGPGTVTASPIQVRLGRRTHVRLEGALAENDVGTGMDVRVDGESARSARARGTPSSGQPVDADDSRLALDLHVGGTLRAPEPVGTIALRAASLRYAGLPPVTDLTLDARVEPARIAVQSASGVWQGAHLLATGAVPLRMLVPEPAPGGPSAGPGAWGLDWWRSLPDQPRSVRVDAKVTNVTSDALAPFVDASRLQEISGTVDATILAEADAFALETVRASVVLDQAELALAGVPFAQSVPTRLRLEGGTARIDDFRWDAQGNEVQVSGGASLLDPAPSIDLAVAGALDLRLLGAFVSGVDWGGVARADLTVRGPLAAPAVVGRVGIEAGELQVDTPPIAASDFEGSVAIGADRMATISLNGLINGGSATLAGKVMLETLADPAGVVTLTARQVMLEYPEGFQTESNAELSSDARRLRLDAGGTGRRTERRLPRTARGHERSAGGRVPRHGTFDDDLVVSVVAEARRDRRDGRRVSASTTTTAVCSSARTSSSPERRHGRACSDASRPSPTAKSISRAIRTASRT